MLVDSAPEAVIEAMNKALTNVRLIIADGARSGFQPHTGDWAQRLYDSQQQTSAALKAYDALLASRAGFVLMPVEAVAATEELRAGLKRGGEAVVRLAFDMEAPNDWTPQFIALGQAMARLAITAGRARPGAALTKQEE